MESNRDIFIQGYKHGIPIGLGYFAVAFSLGIAARDYGFSAFQGFFASLITYASAGQYMGFALYATNTTLAELVLLMFIINARYILMGFALNQRMPEGTPLRTRLLVGSCITDEIFGITMGNILPARIVSALSVALFGMFIAVIIPPARRDKAVLGAVAVSFALSYASTHLPVIADLSQGNRTILLTIMISAVFAALFPRKTDDVTEGGGTDEH